MKTCSEIEVIDSGIMMDEIGVLTKAAAPIDVKQLGKMID